MKRKIRKIFQNLFPIRKEYLTKKMLQNPLKLSIFNVAIAILEIFFIIVGCIRFDFSKPIYAVYMLCYSLLLCGAIAVSIFLFCIRKNPEKYPNQEIFVSYSYAILIAAFATAITLMDHYRGSKNYLTYSILMMLIPVFCILDPFTYLGLVLTTIFTIEIVTKFSFNMELSTGVRLNLITLAVSSFFIEMATYSDQVYYCMSEARLIEISNIDELTGLKNHRKLDFDLEEVAKENVDTVFIMADANNFKSINDKYGHAFGDEVLSSIGDIFRQTFHDCGYRYGGDEMSAVLPAANLQEAILKCNEINERLLERFENGEVKMSFGLYRGKKGAFERPDTPLQKADRALYDAKKNGVVIFVSKES